MSNLSDQVPNISPHTQTSFDKIQAETKVQQGLDFIQNDHENTIADQKVICAVPAPPFKEKVRGDYYLKRLRELGLIDVKMDSEGNVFGVRPGVGRGPKLLVEAHLDTVFPEGTNLQPIEKDGKIYAPGIADDSRGLAAVLCVIRAFNEIKIQTVGDIVFAGTVGEEGLGDLRGMKAFFRDNKDIDASLSVDGTSISKITYLATGSLRYEVNFNGPGGHSYRAFGQPSAIHAMGRAIAKIGDVETPTEPTTTFTVGTVNGGTSVNSIAARAQMLLDMRSNSKEELQKLEAEILQLIQAAVHEENCRWNSEKKVFVEVKLVGDRPAGSQSSDSILVQTAWLATQAIGQKPKLLDGSTNANHPISIGVPAITIGGGGVDSRNHSLDECFDPTDAYWGPQKIFLAILGLVGIDGVTPPLFPPK